MCTFYKISEEQVSNWYYSIILFPVTTDMTNCDIHSHRAGWLQLLWRWTALAMYICSYRCFRLYRDDLLLHMYIMPNISAQRDMFAYTYREIHKCIYMRIHLMCHFSALNVCLVSLWQFCKWTVSSISPSSSHVSQHVIQRWPHPVVWCMGGNSMSIPTQNYIHTYTHIHTRAHTHIHTHTHTHTY